MFIGLCIIAIVDEWKTNLMSLAILFHQLQQGDKTHHTKHTTTHRKVTLMLKHPSLQNKATDVVIHQHSRKLLKMDILMSETCWALNKWNKIASDIKLVFHSSKLTLYLSPLSYFCYQPPSIYRLVTQSEISLHLFYTNIYLPNGLYVDINTEKTD